MATQEVTVDAMAADAIRRGIAAADEDRVVPAAAVKKLVSQWDFQVFYTDPALRDLEEFLERSWEEHADITEAFGQSLLDHVDLLRGYPHIGHP